MNILRRSLTTCSLGHVLQILNFFQVFLFLTHFENCLDTNQDPWMRRRVRNGKISSRARNTSLSRSFCRAPVLVSVSVRINIPPQGRTGILLQVGRYSFPLYLGQFKKKCSLAIVTKRKRARILYSVQNISSSVSHRITFVYYWVPGRNIPLSFQLRKFEWNKQNLNANFHKNYWFGVNNRLRTVTYRPQKILYYEVLPTWGKAPTILERAKKKCNLSKKHFIEKI